VLLVPVLLRVSSFLSSWIGIFAALFEGTKNFLMDCQADVYPLRAGPSSLFGLVLAASDRLFSSTI